ncbi:hypothetical protein AAF712_010147 [Marasmius tenuissimus]|uniref:Ribonuclease H1 N-terminal domain-containing protein n=1 Tax=Marasmius tenuissimus TaxID=585030 RepID=A0ABR2ZPL1_9AGAR
MAFKADSPLYSRKVTKSSTRTVEQRSPTKTVTRTTTHTKTVVVTTSPSGSVPRPPPSPQFSDSDNPNDDAVIEFATDSEEEEEIPPPTYTPMASGTHPTNHSQPVRPPRSQSVPLPRPQTARPPRSSHSPPATTSGTADTSNDEQIAAYYESRYPGLVPYPGKPENASLRGTSLYYVVTAGRSVGIFTDWNYASSLVSGVSNASHQRHTRSFRAWLAYRHAWASKSIRILDNHQDTAPLHTQILDNGLDRQLGNLSLI